MPYRKRYKRKYRRRGKKSAYGIAKKALKKVTFLSKGVEHKHFDVDASISQVDFAGDLTPLLNIPPQGIADFERIGDQIFVTSLHLRMRFVIGTARVNTQCRCVVFWDKYATINLPAEILAITLDTNAPLSHYNVDIRRDWIRLADFNVALTDVHQATKVYNKVIKINKTVKFDAGLTDINKGRLQMLYISNIPSTDAAANKPNMLCESRIYYMDL